MNLPQRAFATLPENPKQIIMITRYQRGYTAIDSQLSADELNALSGVNKGQVEAMLAGSMFGWSVPAANPNMYLEDGSLVESKKGH